MSESNAGAPAFPIVEQLPVRLGVGERRAIRDLADRIRAADPAIGSTRWMRDRVRIGARREPGLFIHDTASIQVGGRWRPSALEYRALPLAGDGDVVVLWTPRVPAFERYYRDVLDLGSVEVIRTTTVAAGSSLAERARRDAGIVTHAAGIARSAGGLTIHPYIGAAGAWLFASTVAERAGAPIRVAAPPPGLTRRVNDKLWFAAQVSRLLGHRALPETMSAYGPSVLAARIRDLARAHDRIAIKLPSAAGGEGNIVLDGAGVRDRPLRAVRDDLRRLLLRRGWRRPFPVLVSAWESPIPATPSVQLWIPLPDAGLPVVEGIFEQRVAGRPGVFVGAVPARLPASCLERIAREAVVLGTLFQHLGYFGRCSLDAILIGDDADRASVHWVECNGRWGGTSIPMTLVDRLVGDWTEAPFAVVAPGTRPDRAFDDAMERVGEWLYEPGARSGIVFLTPGGGVTHPGISFLAIAGTVDEAGRMASEASELLRPDGER